MGEVKRYTQGVCMDGAAILLDGKMQTIEEILGALNSYDALRAVIDQLRADLETSNSMLVATSKAGIQLRERVAELEASPLMAPEEARAGIALQLKEIERLRAENAELVAALEAALEETSYEDTGYQIATIIQAALAKHRGGTTQPTDKP